MERNDVRAALARMATLLDLQGADPQRVRAYQSAARAVAAYPAALAPAVASGAVARLKGVSPETLETISDLVATGRSRALDDLEDRIPPVLIEMLALPGLGVAKIRRIHERLEIDSLDELAEAARDGRLAALPRFGQRTVDNVLRGIDTDRAQAGRRLFHHAQSDAEGLARQLAALSGVHAVHVAGSLRRACETIGDLDFVLVIDGPADALFERLARAPGVTESVRAGGRAATLRFDRGAVADIYPCSPAQLGFQLVRATGADRHVAELRAHAQTANVTWTEHGLRRDGALLDTPTEESVYQALGLPWIAPELREGAGEIDAARRDALPTLVRREDLRGFLHCHTNYSDGHTTVEEWGRACAAAGFQYVGITDHSQTSASAGGLGAEDVTRQLAEIDEVNARLSDVTVLKGVEADILEDGSLDYTRAVREQFDFIIASIHTRHGMDRQAMTDRILRAMDDPTMTILGHPTGRLLLAREPYELDLDRVFRAAAERGVAIEINADPQRLDLDWRVVRDATAAGVTISIGADAHGTAGLSNVDIGVGIARKGWVAPGEVLNTKSCSAFRAFARRARS